MNETYLTSADQYHNAPNTSSCWYTSIFSCVCVLFRHKKHIQTRMMQVVAVVTNNIVTLWFMLTNFYLRNSVNNIEFVLIGPSLTTGQLILIKKF